VRWLAAVTGKPYRLLSETEYEYATRAGTSTAYPWGDDIKVNGTAMANCNACGSKWDGRETAPVGSFAPNAFGLYDMVGNVLEWVEDCAHESFEGAPIDGSAWVTDGDCSRHVARGGCYAFPPSSIRSAYRLRTPSAVRFNALGLRVGRTLLAP
jgi:formylglycine-generating enzyme required for sulfatase activity